jgi:anthranilate synthase component 1
MIRLVERLPNVNPDPLDLPDSVMTRPSVVAVFDAIAQEIILATSVRPAAASPAEAYAAAEARLAAVIADLQRPTPPLSGAAKPEPDRFTTPVDRETYRGIVERAKDYIRAGDIFQVVLSRRLDLPFAGPPLEIYRTLRVVNPSPFMFYLRSPACTLVGSSPEIMVRAVDGTVTVRPLAGTRRRGASPEEDRALAEDLLADPKERAEHVMLIDLGRNDVGRVAAVGTVELSDVMTIERYSHVMHLTSNVTGRLRPELSAFDALRACLPAGTVSGAPKIRAMQIIDELEPVRRGPYAGAVGYVDFAGSMDTCIALRTIVVKDGRAFVQSGAGIVADSVPESEFEETLNKARGLLVSIEMTADRLAAAGDVP